MSVLIIIDLYKYERNILSSSSYINKKINKLLYKYRRLKYWVSNFVSILIER